MRVLACGPFHGEFGYELMAWQARMRARSRSFDKTVVGCRETSKALYEDFATEFRFVPYSIEACCHRSTSKASGVEEELKRLGKGRMDFWERARPLRGGEFVKYGVCLPGHSGVVLIHARDTPKTHFGKSSLLRNWPKEKWDALLERFPDNVFMAIGQLSESLCPRGAVDQRGNPLRGLMDLLASCRLLIGPQSGPTHLAALCGCRVLVWTDREAGPRGMSNERRLLKIWNPLKTPVTIIDGFDASVDTVAGALGRLIGASGRQADTAHAR